MAIKRLQASLVEVGRIRTGTSVGTGRLNRRREEIRDPKKLEVFRFTSPDRALIEAVAEVYGGTPQPWEHTTKKTAEWEVISEVDEIPVYAPRQAIEPWYESWAGGVCQRRCDGEVERIRSHPGQPAPCLCIQGEEGHLHDFDSSRNGKTCVTCNADRQCKLSFSYAVMLADVPGIGQWRSTCHGYYGATEWSSLADLLAATPMPLPGRLKLEQREQRGLAVAASGAEKVEVKKYPVPVLKIDAVSARQLALGGDALSKAIEFASREGVAIGAGPQRQAIGAGPDQQDRQALPAGAPRNPDGFWIERIRRATTREEMEQIREEAVAAAAATGPVTQAWNARAEEIGRQLQAPAAAPAAAAAPAPSGPSDPDQVDMLWGQILKKTAELGWNLDTTERMYMHYTGHDSGDDEDGQCATRMGSFLAGLRDGTVR